MADQADVMDALQAMAGAACFSNGYGQPSITGRVIHIGQGWPLSTDIDAAIAANQTMVSIYSIPSSTGTVETPFDWNPGVIAEPNPGITATETDAGFSIGGTPAVGAYVTAVINGQAFSIAAAAGDTAQTLAASISAAIVAGGIAASAAGPNVNLWDYRSLAVRVGAPATVGRISHRQKQNFQITVWAPSPSDRSVVAGAINVALRRDNSFILPDTSTMVFIAAGDNLDDKREQTSGFHRALIYTVQWDTLDEYPAWEITSFSVGFGAPAGSFSAAG